MTLPTRLITACKCVAMASEGTGVRQCFRVGAILFHRKYILQAKHNSYKTHPALTKFFKYPYMHAEAACILAHGLENCEGLDMLVMRVGKKNDVTMAKPCDSCSELIKHVGIRKVHYSDWGGHVVCA